MDQVVDFVSLHWPVLAPVLLGAVAVYLLLPRPQAFPTALGLLASVLALGIGLTVLVPVTGVGWVEPVLFFAFSGLALLGGTALVTQRNPARGAMAFALVVLSVSGLFLLQAAPFLMASSIIVYAGAIIVTFLFVLMLSQPKGYSDADDRTREPALAVAAGFLLMATMLLSIRNAYAPDQFQQFEQTAAPLRAALQATSMEDALAALGDRAVLISGLQDQAEKSLPPRTGDDTLTAALDDLARIENYSRRDSSDKDLDRLKRTISNFLHAAAKARETVGQKPPPEKLTLSPFSGPPVNNRGAIARDPATGRPLLPAATVAALGRSLFSDYLLAVELAGTALLVATVGAIAVANRRPEGKP
jgi:NADH-quinone oxidoreductase subunit J